MNLSYDPQGLAEKLCQVLTLNWDLINEVGYLPHIIDDHSTYDDKDETNGSYPFILAEANTKLGIPQGLLPHLFLWLRSALINHSKSKVYSPTQIEEFSRCMLLVNPSWYPNYAIRKQGILDGRIDVKMEFQLLNMGFSLPQMAKNSLSWYHREWLNNFILKGQGSIPEGIDFESHLANEIEFAFYVAHRSSRNYYVWEFMVWMLNRAITNQPSHSNQLVRRQFKTTLDFITTNLSDSGAFHHLATLVNLDLCTNRNSYINQPSAYLKTALDEVHKLIERYPGRRQSAINGLFNLLASLSSKASEYVWVKGILEQEVAWIAAQLNLAVESLSADAEFIRLLKAYKLKIKRTGSD